MGTSSSMDECYVANVREHSFVITTNVPEHLSKNDSAYIGMMQ